MRILGVPYTREFDRIVRNIDFCPQDTLEVQLMTNCTSDQIHDTIIQSCKDSTECWLGLVDGKPAGVYGYHIFDKFVIPWMLSNGVVVKDKTLIRDLLRITKEFKSIIDGYGLVCYNVIPEANKRTIRYLTATGFTFDYVNWFDIKGVRCIKFYSNLETI